LGLIFWLLLYQDKSNREKEEHEPQVLCRMPGRLTEPFIFFYLILKDFLEPGEPDTFGECTLVWSSVPFLPPFSDEKGGENPSPESAKSTKPKIREFADRGTLRTTILSHLSFFALWALSPRPVGKKGKNLSHHSPDHR